MPHTRENLSTLLMKYAIASNQFDDYYRDASQREEGVPTEADVEKQMDEAVKMMEAALMQQPKEALIELIFAFLNTNVDVTGTEGRELFLKMLRHFNNYEAFNEPDVA